MERKWVRDDPEWDGGGGRGDRVLTGSKDRPGGTQTRKEPSGGSTKGLITSGPQRTIRDP